MSQVLIVKPVSRDVHWIFNLRINHQRNRFQVCLKKINRLFRQSRQGHVTSIIELYDWYKTIRHIEGYFDKEIVRLTKLIRRKVKDNIEYESFSTKAYRLPVTTPISAALYRVMTKLDTLMCLCDSCITLSIFKKRRLLSQKTDRYKQSVIRLLTRMSQYKWSEVKAPLILNDDNKQALATAIHSDVMPIFTKSVLHQLNALTKKTEDEK